MAPSSSAGDPARTLRLLWRHALPESSSGRGPRQGLSVDAVVDAAVSIADREGLAAVTMRRVAQALGVAAMTLYTYVPGREELLDLMLDTVYARMPATEDGQQDEQQDGQPDGQEDWRGLVRTLAMANRALFEQHPWLAGVDTARPALGPGAIGKYDRELRAFDGHGLDDVTMDAALAWVLGFVQGWARSALGAARVQQESARTEEQWWAAAGPVLSQVMTPEEFPLAVRVGGAAGEAHGAAWEADHAFEFGLERVLDGLAPLLEAGTGDGRPGADSVDGPRSVSGEGA